MGISDQARRCIKAASWAKLARTSASAWAVEGVHGKGFGIVVDGNIYRASESRLQAGRGSTPTGEVVDDEFAMERQGKLRAHRMISSKKIGRSMAPWVYS